VKEGTAGKELKPFEPILGVLAKPQRTLWDELLATPPYFVLYGGTALALRLGHRPSQDFDFFGAEVFEPDELFHSISYLRGAKVVQTARDTLTVVIDRGGWVQISFVGGLGLRRIGEPDICPGNRVQVASLLDLAGCKAEAVQHRAEAKDYQDIAALLLAGVALETILAAGQAVFGPRFDPNRTLRALTFFEDGNLPELAAETQQPLRSAVSGVDVKQLPTLKTRERLSQMKGER
jgi:hypothetical protein